MSEIIYQSYREYKAELDGVLQRTAEGFVKIGYLLKVARDTNILAESPYNNMEEFAYAEYKIDKGTASKFMAINDRFSEDGNSDRLRQEYAGIGWSKLSIMLQLPDSINEEITDNFSKSEIQTLRDEIAEEEKITPIEHVLEGETDTTAKAEKMIDKAVRQLGESEPDLYVQMHEAIDLPFPDKDKIREIMAPAGEQIYSIRIRGIGRIMLSLKDYEEMVSMINERTGEKETVSWDELEESWRNIIITGKRPEESWQEVYEQQLPKKAEVAPVQPQSDEKKTQKKNVKKVVKVNEKRKEDPKPTQPTLHDIEPSIPAPDPVPEEPEEEIQEAAVQEETEEQLPGQINMQEILSQNPEDNVIRVYKEAVNNNLNKLWELWAREKEKKITLMLDTLKNLRLLLEKLEELEECREEEIDEESNE